MAMRIDIHAQAPSQVRERSCVSCPKRPDCNLDIGQSVTLPITPAIGREPVDKNTSDRFSKEMNELGIIPPIYNKSGDIPTIAGAVWTLVSGNGVTGFCTANCPVNLRATVRSH